MARKRKSKVNKTPEAAEIDSKVPRSFVFNRNKLGPAASHLMLEMRKVMSPYTATKLKVREKNVLKDFVSVAGPLGVTHFMMFGRSDVSLNLRLSRVPRGPTLTFHVEQFCLMKDVAAIQKHPRAAVKQYTHPALLVLNNFGGDANHLTLCAKVLQNMFPSISVGEVELTTIKRVALFNYDAESQCIEFRHYELVVQPFGVSKTVKSILKTEVPDLGKLEDISEFLMRGDVAYESDGEGIAEAVDLPEPAHKSHQRGGKSRLKLVELGPRMNLRLLKIEEGLCDGKVLYHALRKLIVGLGRNFCKRPVARVDRLPV
ncbi:uncharacterized protein MONBRDRAFT_13536 [Monosiga brevicollis MX1]|uniref:Brix domain-containing protein n=1 Tax=Monosiga brevicollis TaxID=81824 RepID=A9UNY2_MONBE|nr:uncharacterized protein MONBRDRAFT_13536 [Monosiga brevicollis MX1]EDQ92779.1 predicted protein [Monosiga brevicollis MX1]|eukprot:XP_001742541.1 hypothetical protein [Monosiga brevicollis MX1]